VIVLPPCAQRSEWNTVLETDKQQTGQAADKLTTKNRSATKAPRLCVRLGIKTLRGMSEKHREKFESEREREMFSSIADFAARSGVPRSVQARLATANGFACFGHERREALWQVTSLPSHFGSMPLLDSVYEEIREPAPPLPAMGLGDRVRADFRALGASMDSHPLAVVRPLLKGANLPDAKTLQAHIPNGAHIMIGGMVIARQRPGSAKGMLFMTIEDETGFANLVLTPPVFNRYRSIARRELFILARGKVERQKQVVNLQVDHLETLPMVRTSSAPRSRDFR